MCTPLFTGTEWTTELLQSTWQAIDKIAKEKYGLDYYAPQLEIVTFEQMLEAYSSVGLPFMYKHWSFGKDFIANEKAYKSGRIGLAYELIVNTDPAIAYMMENNSMAMQALVMAHASVGHSAFFKNNHLFKAWTDAKAIVPYLKYASGFIEECEAKYGTRAVETCLDACHALQNYGVHKYKKPKTRNNRAQKESAWDAAEKESYNELWNTIPKYQQNRPYSPPTSAGGVEFPYDNILYFIEKFAPQLQPWEREVVRIVRSLAEYFYPQRQTKMMNEGFASFWHYTIMNDLADEGLITSGAYLEAISSHCGVVAQPSYRSDYYSGINPYALGFSIFRDIKRICLEPTDEDKKWFPDQIGADWVTTIQDVAYNYRDESFILQFLSPKVIRDMALFCVQDREGSSEYLINFTQGDEDVLRIRQLLAEQYSIEHYVPAIEVASCDLMGNGTLHLVHTNSRGVPLDDRTVEQMLRYVRFLWQKEVTLTSRIGDDPEDA